MGQVSMGQVEQSADAFRGRGMAAQETRRTILECGDRQDGRAGVVAFQLVERRDQPLRVFGQLERGRIRIQLADAGEGQTQQLANRRRGTQQRGQRLAVEELTPISHALPTRWANGYTASPTRSPRSQGPKLLSKWPDRAAVLVQ